MSTYMMLYARYDCYSWDLHPFVQVPCARTKTGHYNETVRRANPTFFCCYFCYVDYKNCASFSPDVTANYNISICQNEHYEISKTCLRCLLYKKNSNHIEPLRNLNLSYRLSPLVTHRQQFGERLPGPWSSLDLGRPDAQGKPSGFCGIWGSKQWNLSLFIDVYGGFF